MDCRMGRGNKNTRKKFYQRASIVIQEAEDGNMDYG